MVPNYTGVWNRGLIYRGNTLDGFSMRLVNKVTNEPIIPTSVCSQIVDHRGRHVHTLEYTISSNGRVTFEAVDGMITEGWAPGPYSFGVKYIDSTGRTRTYLMASLQIIEDNQKCRAP